MVVGKVELRRGGKKKQDSDKPTVFGEAASILYVSLFSSSHGEFQTDSTLSYRFFRRVFGLVFLFSRLGFFFFTLLVREARVLFFRFHVSLSRVSCVTLSYMHCATGSLSPAYDVCVVHIYCTFARVVISAVLDEFTLAGTERVRRRGSRNDDDRACCVYTRSKTSAWTFSASARDTTRIRFGF